MSPIEQTIYVTLSVITVPVLLAVIVKAVFNGLNAAIDKGSSRDWPDGFNGNERGFDG